LCIAMPLGPDFFEHRKRVIEDAYELIAAVEISEPLTLKLMDDLRRAGTYEVPIALRRLLPRFVILTMLRLLEDTRPGATGTTAGIAALAVVAENAGALTPTQRTAIDTALDELTSNMIADDLAVDDLKRFRHSSIGHSLIPHKPLSNDLRADLVFKHARAVVALVEKIEQMFAANGVSVGPPVIEKPSDWKQRSADFWKRLT